MRMINYYFRIIILIEFIIFWMYIMKIKLVYSFESTKLCLHVPGLTEQQRRVCTEAPDAFIALSEGLQMGAQECRYQFRGHRWDCTQVWPKSSFGQVINIHSQEAAFTYAIVSAGAAHAVAAACARGNISTCSCDKRFRSRGTVARRSSKANPFESNEYSGDVAAHWDWGGCSHDTDFGMKYARKFLDAREIERDARKLMNLHNNRVGRKLIKNLLRKNCKCHGVSGSCTTKTCWMELPPFRVIGDALMRKYRNAIAVRGIEAKNGLKLVISKKERLLRLNHQQRHQQQKQHEQQQQQHQQQIEKPHQFLEKKSNVQHLRKPMMHSLLPKRMELVYLERSPDYCERNASKGIQGTKGRMCERSSSGPQSCHFLCCGRGYNTRQVHRKKQCKCIFEWCCQVRCEICEENFEEFTCK